MALFSKESNWRKGALAIAIGIAGASAIAVSANTIATVTGTQLATGSSSVNGCTGTATVSWTPNPTYLSPNDTDISGGTLTLTGDCIIASGASTVVVTKADNSVLNTAQIATAAGTQVFTFAAPVSTKDIANVVVTVRKP